MLGIECAMCVFEGLLIRSRQCNKPWGSKVCQLGQRLCMGILYVILMFRGLQCVVCSLLTFCVKAIPNCRKLTKVAKLHYCLKQLFLQDFEIWLSQLLVGWLYALEVVGGVTWNDISLEGLCLLFRDDMEWISCLQSKLLLWFPAFFLSFLFLHNSLSMVGMN